MDTSNIHDNPSFSLMYTFYNDTHETEISMMVNGKNILAFTRNNRQMTTKWNLNDLAFWLRDFLDNLKILF